MLPIKWDRDTCVRCGMAIGDRRFAVRLRGGPKNEAFKFDDIGCATTWCSEKVGQHPWMNDPATRWWVADFSGKRPAAGCRRAGALRRRPALAHGLQPAPPTPSRRPAACPSRPWPSRRPPPGLPTAAPARPIEQDMKAFWLTAKLDIVESLRARWFQVYTLVFGGIVALLFLFGLTESRVLGFIGLSRLLVTYIQLTMAILPIFVLITTVRSVAGDREAGVYEYLLSLPVSLGPGSGARSSAATW
jgi:hypothetical protein